MRFGVNIVAKFKLFPLDPTAGKALKGRHSKAMGLDPSPEPPMGFQALKGRNTSTLRQDQYNATSARRNGLDCDVIQYEKYYGNYFAPSGLRSAGIHPTMGQDPSLCYFAPLGLCLRNHRVHRLKQMFSPMRNTVSLHFFNLSLTHPWQN